MEILIIYDKRIEQSNMQAYLLKAYYTNSDNTVTLKEVSLISQANITTYCTTTLVDGTYDHIYVSSKVTDVNAAGNMTYAAYAALREKLIAANQGTLMASGTSNGAGTPTRLILEDADVQVDNYYQYMILNVTGGTNSGYKGFISSSDQVGKYVTAATAVGVGFDATDVYAIYDASDFLHKFDGLMSSKTPVTQCWEFIKPTVTIPLLFHYADFYSTIYTPGYGFAQEYGVAQSGGATSLVFAASQGGAAAATPTERTTNDHFNGMFLYIIAGTGAGQWREITDYDGGTLTPTVDTWTTNPDNTSVYRVVKNFKEVWYDRATEMMFRGIYNDPTDSESYTNFVKMIDKDGKLQTKLTGSMAQDVNYLWNTFMPQAIAALKWEMFQ